MRIPSREVLFIRNRNLTSAKNCRPEELNIFCFAS